MRYPLKLDKSLDKRKEQATFRALGSNPALIDFSSNDYLGFANCSEIFNSTHQLLKENDLLKNGASGSRLLSGNHMMYAHAENYISRFHEADTALIFNSGYAANMGFFSSIPQRGDVILYDELVHSSIRDGIKMSNAKAFKFSHNDLEDLQLKIQRHKNVNSLQEIYIVTESVFSMDGDMPDLITMAGLGEELNCFLVVDEAHALGVFGNKGEGVVQQLGIEEKVFARIMTFGKGLGCHGAAILGSDALRNYLINFASSFIYTTALPPHPVAGILTAYKALENTSQIKTLQQNIKIFKEGILANNLQDHFLPSNSAIQSCIIPNIEKLRETAVELQLKGYNVKPILHPTVSKGKERLRFCIHSFNTKEEISQLLKLLANFIV